MERNYELAIEYLNGRKTRPKERLDDMRGSDDMVQWLKLIGHSIDDLDKLNVIHISGTNGKGSTCSFASSFLLSYAKRTGYPQKVGLYTSPHMRTIRERIQINGDPISEDLFTRRFFEVWDKLPTHPTESLDIPRYLQLLALVSQHTFLVENVDIAILETHLGGEFDATNIVKSPVVTAVTSIAMDHVELLGPKIQNIAWHKAGIFKSGSSAFSALQSPIVAAVLEERAAEKNVQLEFIGVDGALPTNAASLKPLAQRQNCSLALALVRAWLRVMRQNDMTSDDVSNGVKSFQWPGRFQRITEGTYEWFLDGAHNDSGIPHAVQWYAESIRDYPNQEAAPIRILVFCHLSKRDGLLRCIAQNLKQTNTHIQHVILTSHEERKDRRTRIDRNIKKGFDVKTQELYANTWRDFDPDAEVSIESTIEEALNRARRTAQGRHGIQTLITGSLHLVSGALCLLEPDKTATLSQK